MQNTTTPETTNSLSRPVATDVAATSDTFGSDHALTGTTVTRRAFAAVASAAGLTTLAACGPSGPGSGADASSAHTATPSSTAPASDGENNPDAPAGAPGQIDSLIESLTPREAAAQLLLVGFPEGTQPLTSEPVGGYFLLGKWNDSARVRTALGDARDAGFTVPPLFSVDQEGGNIRVLRGSDVPETASAATLGAKGPEAVAEAYSSLGKTLAELGFHLDLAPVADVVEARHERENAPVGALKRNFGTDPDAVADCVSTAIAALDAAGVGSAIKHFPGLGRVRANTDFAASGITDPITTAEDPFLMPFIAGIDAETDAVMVSTAIYSKIDPEAPAIHSRAIVTDLLRGSLGYSGVAVTDDVGAAASVSAIDPGERATMFLAAGGDVTLTADPALATTMIDAIEAWAKEHPEDFRSALTRWLTLKQRRGLIA